MAGSMREALDAAFKKQEEIGGPEEDTEEPLRPTGEEEEETTTEEEVDDKSEEEVQPDPEKGEEDDQGGEPEESKDPPKSTKAKSAKPGDKSVDEKDAPGKGGDDLKAPVSWKPAVREHWGKLPKEVREEVLRREGEIAKGLHQASGFRKVAEEYHRTVKPFEQLIRSQNSTPAQAITNLMTTAARLTMGTKAQKAAVVAEIMKNYDVDVEALDSILAGKPGDPETDKFGRLLEEKLKPVTEFMTTVQSSRRASEQKTDEQLNQELETFASDPKNEFFNDVVEDMADIMDMAAKRGQKVTLGDAYTRACQLHPEISKVISQREAARKGRLDAERLRKKTNAASSIRGARGEDNDTKAAPTDVRSAVAAAWADAEEAR